MTAFSYGNDVNGAFRISFPACSREPQSWKEEVYQAARSIANRANKPIYVCSSGGIDSEIACRALYEQAIPFSVISLEQTGGVNRYDIDHAISWCAERGIKHTLVPLDIKKFFSKDIGVYSEKYKAIHPFRYLQLKLLETVEAMGGFGVLCSGEQMYHAKLSRKELTKGDMYLEFSNGHAVALEWCKDNKTEHEPYFYFSTPELCLAYTQVPLISFALSNPDPIFRHYANTYALKRIVYQSVWPDLKIRNKFHGFEGVLSLYNEATETLRKKFMSEYRTSNISIPDFERQLKGN